MSVPSKNKFVVIFAGAGASKAVSSEHYPTTEDFFNNLPKESSSDSLFVEVFNFIKSHTILERHAKGSSVIDIEVMLWHLEELRQFLRNSGNVKNIVGYFMNGSRLGNAVGAKNESFGSFKRIAEIGVPRIERLVSQIHEQVYSFYARQPEINELEKNWLPLLRTVIEQGCHIELATTNYDVILESVIEELDENEGSNIDTGRTGRFLQWLDLSLWGKPLGGSSQRGLLTKLHGSVDWQRGESGDGVIHTGTPTFAGRHERHLILYPGFKGTPTDPEFQAFHEHFRGCLAAATGVLFIGFAFRDEYINELCRQQLEANTSANIVVLNPEPDIQVPGAGQRVKRIEAGFDKSSVGDAVKHLLS